MAAYGLSVVTPQLNDAEANLHKLVEEITFKAFVDGLTYKQAIPTFRSKLPQRHWATARYAFQQWAKDPEAVAARDNAKAK